MEQLWRLMYEVCMDLACFTPSYILDDIGYHGWPIISKPVQSIFEFWAWLMSSAYAVVRFFKHFLRLWIRKATEEDTVIWAMVECLYYWIIVKTESPSSDRCHFFRVIWQYIMQNIINEGKSPISRFEIRRDIIDLSGSQHMFRADKVSSCHRKVILGVDWQG